jgi:hypothetical protein
MNWGWLFILLAWLIGGFVVIEVRSRFQGLQPVESEPKEIWAMRKVTQDGTVLMTKKKVDTWA